MNSEELRALQVALRQQQHDLAQQQARLFASELELQRSMHIYEGQVQLYRRTNAARQRRHNPPFSSQESATRHWLREQHMIETTSEEGTMPLRRHTNTIPPKSYWIETTGQGMAVILLLYKQPQEKVLHLCWTRGGDGTLEFSGLWISNLYLSVLKETALMDQLVCLPLELSVRKCEELIQSWGFVHRELTL